MTGKQPMSKLIIQGNAFDDSTKDRGSWFIGNFILPEDSLQRTGAVEVKWGVHAAGEEKPSSGTNMLSTTLTLLISGRFLLTFPDTGLQVTLERTGDYLIYAPAVKHTWKSIEPSVVLTVRWPSIPGDQVIG